MVKRVDIVNRVEETQLAIDSLSAIGHMGCSLLNVVGRISGC